MCKILQSVLPSVMYISIRNPHFDSIVDIGYKSNLFAAAEGGGFAVLISPLLIFNKKNGGHNILWSAFYFIFKISRYILK
jgi:hypothetical protein